MRSNSTILDVVIPARGSWSGVLKRGQVMRCVDLGGQQSLDALFYNADNLAERYSAQATVAAQNSPYIGDGTGLISDEGRVMARVVADTCGRHDTSAGACSCEANTVRFGHHTRFMHACRENFLFEAMKHGMGKRDLVGNANFFMNVPIARNGEIVIDDGLSAPGGFVDLQPEEMDVLCLFSACPQVNNPCNGFVPTPIRLLIREA